MNRVTAPSRIWCSKHKLCFAGRCCIGRMRKGEERRGGGGRIDLILNIFHMTHNLQPKKINSISSTIYHPNKIQSMGCIRRLDTKLKVKVGPKSLQNLEIHSYGNSSQSFGYITWSKLCCMKTFCESGASFGTNRFCTDLQRSIISRPVNLLWVNNARKAEACNQPCILSFSCLGIDCSN